MKPRKHTRVLLKVFRQLKAEGLQNKAIAERMAADGYKGRDEEPVTYNVIQNLSKISYNMRRPSAAVAAGKPQAVSSDANEIATLILSSKLSDESKVKALKAIYA